MVTVITARQAQCRRLRALSVLLAHFSTLLDRLQPIILRARLALQTITAVHEVLSTVQRFFVEMVSCAEQVPWQRAPQQANKVLCVQPAKNASLRLRDRKIALQNTISPIRVRAHAWAALLAISAQPPHTAQISPHALPSAPSAHTARARLLSRPMKGYSVKVENTA